jgi:hypothetical protein
MFFASPASISSFAHSSRFVAVGHARARAAMEPAIRKEVVAKYISRLENANLLVRFILWWRIEGEIERRINEKAPLSALY